MKSFLTLILCLTIATFAQAQAQAQAQKVELSLNLLEGKTYTQSSESNISIIQNMNGREMEIGMLVKGRMSYKVLNASKEEYEIAMTYERLSMNMDLPQGNMEFSSKNGSENDIMSTVLSGITKKPVTIILTRKGKVTRVTQMDSIWASVFDQFSEVPEAQLNQVRNQIKEAYGAEALKGNIEMVTANFPSNRVSTGDEWTHTTDGGYSRHCRLKWNVDEIKIDKLSGWIIEAINKQEIEGKAHIQASPQMPMKMTIPMTIKMTIPMTIKNETVITQ